MKITPLARTLSVLAALVALAPAPISAVSFDTSGIPGPPPPPVVSCTITEGDITVTSFAGVLGYQLKGPCKVSFPGTKLAPVPSAPYEGGGSWTAATGAVNEFIKGRDAKGQIWEVHGSANCHLDPWMTGIAAAGCNGTIASATPNAPVKIFKSMQVPVTAGVLDQQARAFLTGKTLKAMAAENQAPVVVKPAEGALASVPVALTIQAGPGSPTKNFALEWQSFENGAWVPKTIQDQAGLDSKIPIASFGNASQVRVRARAHQAPNAKWSDWRSFKVPYLPPPPPPVTPTPCPNTAAYGATYDVSGMPSSIKAGTTGTATIKITNTSNQIWPAGSNFHLAYHWAQNGVVVIYNGERTFLPTTVLPCFSIVLTAKVVAPPTAGAYQVQWDMLLENVAWFSAQGVPTGNKDVTVTP